MKSCRSKRKFRKLEDAVVEAERYHDNIVLVFGQMTPYMCQRHQRWHIGHSYRSGTAA